MKENQKTVLLVGDIMSDIPPALQHCGYLVIIAGTAEQAIDALSNAHITVVIVNYDQSDIASGGLEDQLHNRNIPYIVTTTHQNCDIGNAAWQLLNPITPAQLMDSIEAAIKTHKTRKRQRREYDDLQRQSDQNITIQMAVGMLVERHRLASPAIAMEHIRSQANGRRKCAYTAAKEIIDSALALNGKALYGVRIPT